MAFPFRNTDWYHDFPKLAKESGFYFNAYKSNINVNWSLLNFVDIDSVIRDRDFLTVDENINNIIDCCLDAEYDINTLDPKFFKLFRLAQLTIEYLVYCKQYLDHSVVILKDELKLKIKEILSLKKEINVLQEVINVLREDKSIDLKINGDATRKICKCPYCPKTFVSDTFTKAHVMRRHSHKDELYVSPHVPIEDQYCIETKKLYDEIKMLKDRLNQTERIIRNESVEGLNSTTKGANNNNKLHETGYNNPVQNKQLHEMNTLKSIIHDEIEDLKRSKSSVYDSVYHQSTNLRALMSQQENEIQKLRYQLLERVEKFTPDLESMRMKLKTQEDYWRSKIEQLECQHRMDMEKLTSELKLTQKAADHVKVQYASKVNDLEKETANQSNILAKQSRQLYCLTLEINSQQNLSSRQDKSLIKRTFEDNELIIENFDVMPHRKSSSEPLKFQQYYSQKNVSNDNDKENEEIISSSNRSTKNTTGYKEKLTGLGSEDVLTEKLKKGNPLKTVSRILDDDNAISEINSECSYTDISMPAAEHDSHSISKIADNAKYSVQPSDKAIINKLQNPPESLKDGDNIKYRSKLLQDDLRMKFEKRLRDLGIDPEWEGIPRASFKKKMDIIKYHEDLNIKRLPEYSYIKQEIIEELSKSISKIFKSTKDKETVKGSLLLDELMPDFKSNVVKTFHVPKTTKGSVKKQYTSSNAMTSTPTKERLITCESYKIPNSNIKKMCQGIFYNNRLLISPKNDKSVLTDSIDILLKKRVMFNLQRDENQEEFWCHNVYTDKNHESNTNVSAMSSIGT